jgi:predicted nuclease of restriction endonuclease-like (RecB) superfamily
MSKSPLQLPADYAKWLTSLKQRIKGARQRALLAANSEQIRLYHDIGRDILDRQSRQGWGAKVIDHLSADLRAAFPDMRGLSASNLKYMRFFAAECPNRLIGQQSADQLPWFHIVTLITKLQDQSLREWYAREALEQSWPRETLDTQIKNRLHLRKGAAVTNFERSLAPERAGLASQFLKDPYHFDFLGLGDEAHERDIENALMRHITRFQARGRRPAELLSRCGGRSNQGTRRCSYHRSVALPYAEPTGCRIRALRNRQAHRHRRVPTCAGAPGTFGYEFAQHRRDRSRIVARSSNRRKQPCNGIEATFSKLATPDPDLLFRMSSGCAHVLARHPCRKFATTAVRMAR